MIFSNNSQDEHAKEVYVRKLQKISTGSYIIALPSSWIKLNNLSPHDPLLIINNGKIFNN